MSGRIFTFYSWKGGVGRTMALANAGVQLARRGKRVLLVDWDLEAPGLDRYFLRADQVTASRFSLKAPSDETGLLGLLCSAAAEALQEPASEAWERRVMTVTVPDLPKSKRTESLHPEPQPLHLLSSGLDAPDYAERLQAFSWESFFADGNGGQWLETLRSQWRDAYDVVLIDSRTGLTDGGGVCTVQMPDALVLVFTANMQSLQDGLAFLRGVHRARAAFAFERAPLTVIPLLARWEGDREVDLADSWLDRMEPEIAQLVDTWLPSDIPVRRVLERLRVPHVARFSFGEPLPVLTHSLSDPDRPGLAYDLLAELLAAGFADAGPIIEPGYQPPFDVNQATSAEIDALVRNDHALEAAIKTIVERDDADWMIQVDQLMRLGNGAFLARRLMVADAIIQRAASIARSHFTAQSHDPNGGRMLARALRSQGDLRRELSKLVEAMLAYRESLAVSRRLATEDPSNVVWQRDIGIGQEKIGDVLFDQGNLDGALAAFKESLEVRRQLAEADPSNDLWQRDVSISQERIADVLRDRGDLDGALTAYRQSLTLSGRLTEIDPSNALWQRDLSIGQEKIGDVLFDQGKLDAALAAYEQSLAVLRRLSEADPSNVVWQRDLSVSQERIANVLREQGDLDGALATYKQSLAARRLLSEADPSNALWRRDLSVIQAKIGDVLRDQGNLEGALASYRESMEARRRLADADPANAAWQRDIGVVQMRIGDVLRDQGNLEEALAAYYESLAVSRRLAEADPSNAVWQRDLSVSLTNLAQALERQGRQKDALALAEESLSIDEHLTALDPSNATWREDVDFSRALFDRLRGVVEG